MKIAITDTITSEDKFRLYADWIDSANTESRWIKLSYLLDNLEEIEKSDGLLITGGGDVNPALYGGVDNHPTVKGIDERRDAFERNLLDCAMKKDIPILAICRGMQLVNVHFGGTLLIDIEEAGYQLHRSDTKIEKYHPVKIIDESKLKEILGTESGEINSVHHQAVNRPATDFDITAMADDGIIEAMEHKNRSHFFHLLQWHPERMNGESIFSKNILKEFLTEAFYYSTSKK
ncbi:MAG: gamma-glutamyl-gamma-aminobutyrate hydrolase family protein [Ignavibacteriales bacterium]|nr:gamma-glutamyl-gamma-aminobutyrate hydrolase family protein [Ignavibacteriales bacterium]